MEAYAWDGPSDPDEEIEALKGMKMPFEVENGLKFSKNGIIDYVNRLIE